MIFLSFFNCSNSFSWMTILRSFSRVSRYVLFKFPEVSRNVILSDLVFSSIIITLFQWVHDTRSFNNFLLLVFSRLDIGSTVDFSNSLCFYWDLTIVSHVPIKFLRKESDPLVPPFLSWAKISLPVSFQTSKFLSSILLSERLHVYSDHFSKESWPFSMTQYFTLSLRPW